MKRKIQLLAVCLLLSAFHSWGQFWLSNGSLNNGNNGNNLGTINNYPINIYTNGIHRAQFSTNYALSGLNAPGDGLLIYNQQPASSNPLAGQIAIFTSPNFTNGTEIRMGLSGNLAGRNNRLELWGRYNGLFYNTSTGSGVHKFARMGTIYGLLGTNNYWLLGQQTDNLTSAINATRRLHVFDNTIQFRLSYGGPNNAPLTMLHLKVNSN